MLRNRLARLMAALFILFASTSTVLAAAQVPISLNLQNTPLPDAIRSIAQWLNINVIISAAVTGQVSLRLHDVLPEDALLLLLTSRGLAKWQIGNIWFIAPRDELIKRKQEEEKWHAVWNASLPLTTRIWQIQYGKAADIAHLLQDSRVSLLSKRGRVRIDARTNSLCIQDIPERIENIRQIIHHLDVPVTQISIEARLASVDSDFERELGIDFSTEASSTADGRSVAANEMAHRAGRYSVAVAKLADGSLLDVKLAALENAGHAELISSPSLFTANQQTASIEAGEEVPYQEVSESGGTAVTFKKAVLGLKVTPQILPGGRVLLQLHITQDRPSNRMVLGMPTIKTRQIMTNVLVKNGQTIVLGGIYETNHENDEQRVPFLSKAPIIGWLFKQRNTVENKRELLIFVTPRLMQVSASPRHFRNEVTRFNDMHTAWSDVR